LIPDIPLLDATAPEDNHRGEWVKLLLRHDSPHLRPGRNLTRLLLPAGILSLRTAAAQTQRPFSEWISAPDEDDAVD